MNTNPIETPLTITEYNHSERSEFVKEQWETLDANLKLLLSSNNPNAIGPRLQAIAPYLEVFDFQSK